MPVELVLAFYVTIERILEHISRYCITNIQEGHQKFNSLI